MNTNNLIRLGAACQSLFEMKDQFSIMFVPSDARTNRVALRAPQDITSPSFTAVKIDYIDLIKYVSTDNFEKIYVGYSSICNTLVIKEIE